jgi:hypothetical protein
MELSPVMELTIFLRQSGKRTLLTEPHWMSSFQNQQEARQHAGIIAVDERFHNERDRKIF